MTPAIRGLGDVAPHVKAAAEEIAAKFNVTNIGGRASAGHISNSDHYTGHAIDVMVLKDKAKGDAIAAYVIANAARLGVKYVIWYKRFWEPSEPQWVVYVVPPGGSAHYDHVHISFNSQPGTGGSPVESSASGLSDNAGCLSLIQKVLGM